SNCERVTLRLLPLLAGEGARASPPCISNCERVTLRLLPLLAGEGARAAPPCISNCERVTLRLLPLLAGEGARASPPCISNCDRHRVSRIARESRFDSFPRLRGKVEVGAGGAKSLENFLKHVPSATQHVVVPESQSRKSMR